MWERTIKSIDQGEVRRKLQIEEGKEVIVYIAGWSGDGECAEGTRLFASITTRVLVPSTFQTIIHLHPRSDGELERNLFNGIAKVTTSKNCTTEEVTSIAATVVCHKSTAGLKILAAGKRLIFVIPQTGYRNPVIDSGPAPMVNSAEEFEEMFGKDSTGETRDVYNVLGIPKGSAHHIRDFLLIA